MLLSCLWNVLAEGEEVKAVILMQLGLTGLEEAAEELELALGA